MTLKPLMACENSVVAITTLMLILLTVVLFVLTLVLAHSTTT